ncbi:hypothetical protein E2C01_085900 [Portunus trituberculatus]|uniref:Uncharacterized protein n=1 Tax=Portunus trituberculatus TaxID=210409 RepID=A0A5B7JA48_PORTR|nr:hypothetical protein [Portunus trituberculatus]
MMAFDLPHLAKSFAEARLEARQSTASDVPEAARRGVVRAEPLSMGLFDPVATDRVFSSVPTIIQATALGPLTVNALCPLLTSSDTGTASGQLAPPALSKEEGATSVPVGVQKGALNYFFPREEAAHPAPWDCGQRYVHLHQALLLPAASLPQPAR